MRGNSVLLFLVVCAASTLLSWDVDDLTSLSKPQPLQPSAQKQKEVPPSQSKEPLFEPVKKTVMSDSRFKFDLNACYFQFQEPVLRAVYGSTVLYKGLFYWMPFRTLFCFAGGDFMAKKGRSRGGDYPTTLQIGSASLGIGMNLRPDSNQYGLQLSGGVNLFNSQCIPDSPYVKKTASTRLGGDILANFYVGIFKYGCLNFFSQYSYKPAEFSSYSNPPNVKVRSINVGGWAAGGGVGFVY